MDEDFPACTKEHPLHLEFRALWALFAIADEAGRLLDGILNHKPIDKEARRLAVNLSELEMNMYLGRGPDVYWSYAEAFLEVGFTDGRFIRDDNNGVVTLSGITLWKEESAEESEETG